MSTYTKRLYGTILKFGSKTKYTLRSVVEGDWIDPLQPSKGKELTNVDYPITAYRGVHDFKTVDGSSIKTGDFPLYVAGYDLDISIDESYLIVFDDKEHSITDFKMYNVNEDVVFYKLNVRGS